MKLSLGRADEYDLGTTHWIMLARQSRGLISVSATKTGDTTFRG